MAFTHYSLSILRRFMSSKPNSQLVSLIFIQDHCVFHLFFMKLQVESLRASPIADKLVNLEKTIESTPELNGFPVDRWISRFAFFEKEGFNMLKFTSIIQQNPTLMRKDEKEIYDRLEQWRSFHFGDMKLTFLLSEQPELFDIPHNKSLLYKISVIKSLIGNNISSLYKLLVSSPMVFTRTPNELNAMADYIKQFLRINDMSEVYKSSVMAQELDFLKTRYTFMKRLGMYVIKRKMKEGEISKNPKLTLLVDTDDKKFATKVCGVTLDEYEVFKELFKKELEDLEDEKEDEDDLDDDDDRFELKKIKSWRKN
jgi:mTERF domain-containing protein, mitochondrial